MGPSIRNFGEKVYVRLRETHDVDIEEIDAAIDEFHVGVVGDEQAKAVVGLITALASEHHLDDVVYVMIADDFTSYPAVILVLDVALRRHRDPRGHRRPPRFPVRVCEDDAVRFHRHNGLTVAHTLPRDTRHLLPCRTNKSSV